VTGLSEAQVKEGSCPQCGAALAWPVYADVVVCESCGSTLAADAALRAVQCPQCAGRLAAVGGQRLLACCHCGVRLLVKARGGYERWRLPLRVDRQKAQQIARDWLERWPGVAEAARHAPFTRMESLYLPIWEYGALVAGWELGYTARIRGELVGQEEQERLELQPVRETIQDGHVQERRFYEPAADLASVGGNRPRVTGREPLLPLLAGDLDCAGVLAVQGSAAETIARGRDLVLRPTSTARHPDSHLFILHESASLLFYPFWVLEYCRGGCSYPIVVNGYDGTLSVAVAPAGRARRLRERLVTLLGEEARGQGMVEYHDPFSS
jgi:DNA-directed RNA polymerase subunit RPC12/RpoP